MSALRVLIIDDSVTIRAILEHVISNDPACNVVGVAADIGAARALMQSSDPDAITLDLAMPGVDGLQFLRALKGHRHPPIVVVSGSATDGSWERAEALAAGAAACFDKAKLLSHAPQFVRTLKNTARAHRCSPVPRRDAGHATTGQKIETGDARHMDRALLYVSRQAFAPDDQGRVIADIVAVARTCNAATGITGALACTRKHFAQLLEGPAAAIENLMHSIEEDDRHTEVTVLRVHAIARRQFPDWSMAYSGPSSYVARQIEPLIGEIGELHPARVDRLHGLLIGLAKIDAA